MTKDAVFLYVEINLACVGIISIVLHNLIFKGRGERSTLYLKLAIIFAIVANIMDAIWRFTEAAGRQDASVALYILNIVYYVCYIATAYCWFLFSEKIQCGDKRRSLGWLIVTLIPGVVVTVILLLSPWTGAVFTVVNGQYVRGPLVMLPSIVMAVYIAITSVRAFLLARKKEKYSERRMLFTIASYLVLIVICMAATFAFDVVVPANSLSVMFIAVLIIIRQQNDMITIDPLTGLNNRGNLEKYLDRTLKSSDKELENRFFILIDVDDFKLINDRYGHIEGDAALVRVADAMRHSAMPKDFIARYGGDEFFFTGVRDNVAGAKKVCDKLKSEVTKLNNAAGAKFELTVSTGLYVGAKENDTIPEVIARSDKCLYEEKKKKKGRVSQ